MDKEAKWKLDQPTKYTWLLFFLFSLAQASAALSSNVHWQDEPAELSDAFSSKNSTTFLTNVNNSDNNEVPTSGVQLTKAIHAPKDNSSAKVHIMKKLNSSPVHRAKRRKNNVNLRAKATLSSSANWKTKAILNDVWSSESRHDSKKHISRHHSKPDARHGTEKDVLKKSQKIGTRGTDKNHTINSVKRKIKPIEAKNRSKRHYSFRGEEASSHNGIDSQEGTDDPLSCLPEQNVQDKVIDIAVLVPSSKPEHYTPCSRDQVMPAVHLAVQHLREQELRGPLEGWNISVHYRDTNCSSTFGPLAAVDLHFQGKADVFLGPVCEYALAPVCRFASVWDTPVLTPGGHPHAFDFKENFPSLTRLRGFDTEVSQVFKSIADYFGWDMIGLLYEESADSEGHSACHLTLSGVHDAFNKTSENRGFVQGVDNLEEVITYFSDKARIIVLCAQNSSIVREILLKAHELGMTTGDFAFFNIQLFATNQSNYRPWFDPRDTTRRNQDARAAFSSLLTITARLPNDPAYAHFTQEVHKIAKEHYDFTYPDEDSNLSPYVVSFYEAVIVYSRALNVTLSANSSILNGTEIRKHLWNHTFANLITGNVSINANGDRNAGYSILDLDEEDNKGTFTVVGAYMGEQLNITEKIFWPGDGPPRDRPKCGFHGELCHSYVFLLVIGILCLLVVVLLAFSVFIYRHYKLEADIARMTWKIDWNEVLDISQGPNKRGGKLGSRVSIRSVQSNLSSDSVMEGGQVFIRTGFYKGTRVAIKRFKSSKIDLTRPLLIELKQMKDLQSEHLVRFVGACVEGVYYGLLTEYCPRGSLQDVLEDEHITLDSMFRFSLMHDVVKGMSFLHSSEIRFHGNLKSTNCVVDSRFVLKLTDFGLQSLRRTASSEFPNLGDYAYWRRKLWTAPEKLRCQNSLTLEAQQRADVYSFAIISHEISFRKGPFYLSSEELEPYQIVENVRNGGKTPFRPSVDEEAIEEEVLQMMKRCWAEDPLDRPDFRHLKGLVRKLNKNNDSGNILDNLLSRMEQYANNLETLVQERTADYLEEKRRCEELLYQLLPKSVASQLIAGDSVMAETYDNVTIYFSDIVGFTTLSAQSTPMQVVELLNDLYSTFDYVIENFNVYKVETIGDAYMVVSGLPDRNGNLHAREIARMSLRLLDTVKHFVIRHRPQDKMQLRIGMHTGPCVAGVVGVKMPRYCLFGDTVNTASRMESSGAPLKIHVSATTSEILMRDFPSFNLDLRGEVNVKGKGPMTTYWLLGEEGYIQEPSPLSPKETLFPDPVGTVCNATINSNPVNDRSFNDSSLNDGGQTDYRETCNSDLSFALSNTTPKNSTNQTPKNPANHAALSTGTTTCLVAPLVANPDSITLQELDTPDAHSSTPSTPLIKPLDHQSTVKNSIIW